MIQGCANDISLRGRHRAYLHQHCKCQQDGNGLHYAKHQSGKEEAAKQEYMNESLNKNMAEMIQQRAMSIANQTKKQKKPKISSPKISNEEA